MSKRPKIIPIRDSYKELFKDEEEKQTPEEIIKRMRSMMKLDKNK